MATAIRTAHKYLGRCAAVFWVLQAATGMMLVFHQPIDASALHEFGSPAHLKSLDAALQQIPGRLPDSSVLEYFPAGGAAGQTDVVIARAGGTQDVVRLSDSDGTIVDVHAWESPWWRLGFFRLVLLIHRQLLGGTAGSWLIAASGTLLAFNILMGLSLAWPPKGHWRTALLPRRTRARAAAIWGWHRALGLWLAAFGLIAASTGALLAGAAGLQPGSAVGPTLINDSPELHGEPIPPSAAAGAALARYPDATLSVVSLPNASDPWYTIRVRRSGELRRVFGTTVVHVDPANGKVIASQDALAASPGTRLMADLYAVHTGEWGGVVTRLLAMTGGLWLAATALLGLTLWWTRRRVRVSGRKSPC